MINIKNNDQENRYKCKLEKKTCKFDWYSRFLEKSHLMFFKNIKSFF